MERIVKLTGDSQLDRLLNEFKESSYNDQKVELHKKLVLDFRKKMQNTPLKKELYAGGNNTV